MCKNKKIKKKEAPFKWMTRNTHPMLTSCIIWFTESKAKKGEEL